MPKTNPQHLLKVCRQFGFRCFWCGRDIIPVSSLPPACIISQSACGVTYIDGSGEEKTVRKASIDHLIRKADGGTNDPENLVASCMPCNNHRHKEEDKATNKLPRKWRGRKTCPVCGADKPKDRMKCSECRKGDNGKNADLLRNRKQAELSC
jgi:HNH endonuclease